MNEKIDESLRRQFTPPPLETLVARVREQAAVPPPRSRAPLWWSLAAAAALAVAVLWALLPSRGERVARLWASTYEHALREGFEQAACCTAPVDLAGLCEERYGCRVELAGDLARLCGTYCGELMSGCTGLLVRAGGEPVCVFVHEAASDPHPDPRGMPGLRLHRREAGGLVLYEVSKLDEPRALAAFHVR
jgi:hypothetical protein